MGPTPAVDRPGRRRYLDWVRGLAALIMLEAHVLDAWTQASSRSAPVYQYLSMLGGFAAPLFLWLAGLSLALAAEGRFQRGGNRLEATSAVVRRGAEIFILAFIFRLQAFVVTPGSWLITLFRVDILNVMGPAIAAAGLIWGLAVTAGTAALANALVAVAVAMATPLIRTAGWVDLLPLWLQWYVRPFGDHAVFTLFPWSGFVFAGAAVGSLLSVQRSRSAERSLLGALSGAGLVVLCLGFYLASRPSIFPVSNFWTTSPTYFAVRVGVMLLVLGAFFLAEQGRPAATAGSDVLQTFGRNSLFIYWIHVEMVYGYASWPLHRHLPLWGTAVGFGVLAFLMLRAVVLRDRLIQAWRTGRTRKTRPEAVPA
jgi:uncharacterized membrane protein